MSKAKSSQPSRRAGRPRDPTVRRAILKAARALIDEHGAGRLTIEAVATRAGVGKPTIYRNWANAQELALSAFLAQEDRRGEEADDEQAPLAALRDLIRDLVKRLRTARGRQMTLMLASAETDSELFKAFRNRVILDTRKQGVDLLKAAIADGTLAAATDSEALIDLVLGAIFFRLLIQHAKLDGNAVDAILDEALRGAARVR